MNALIDHILVDYRTDLFAVHIDALKESAWSRRDSWFRHFGPITPESFGEYMEQALNCLVKATLAGQVVV